jgi:hypothetical protein
MSFPLFVLLLWSATHGALADRVALPHVESDAEFDALLDKWSSMPFPLRRQSVAQHKAAWRGATAVRDELRFMVDWNYVDSVAAAVGTGAHCANLSERADTRLRTLDRLVDLTQRRLAILEARLKESKRQTSATQTELDERMRSELQYMLDYAERVRNVPGYVPQFAYQKRLLNPAERAAIQELLATS